MALIAFATGTSAFAAPKTVSTKVTEHFATSFTNAKNISWNSTEKYDKVSFVLGSEKVNVFYDTEGELLGTSKPIAFDKLPKSSLETLTTRYTYPDYQIKDCIEFINAGNEKNYYVSFEKKNKTVVLEITKAGMVSVFARTKK